MIDYNMNPFFIVGCPRSGTTLLQIILNAHSTISVPPETHFFSKSLIKSKKFFDGENICDLEGFITVLRQEKHMAPFIPFLQRKFFNAGCYTVKTFVEELFSQYALFKGKKNWGEKSPHHLWYWKRISRLFPECKFIVVIRDGCDTANSITKAPWGVNNIFANIFRWKIEVREGYRIRSALGSRRVLIIRYENLVCNSEVEVKRICNFLGVLYEKNMIDYCSNSQVIFHDHEESWKANNKQRIFSSSIGRSQNELSDRTLSILNKINVNQIDLGVVSFVFRIKQFFAYCFCFGSFVLYYGKIVLFKSCDRS